MVAAQCWNRPSTHVPVSRKAALACSICVTETAPAFVLALPPYHQPQQDLAHKAPVKPSICFKCSMVGALYTFIPRNTHSLSYILHIYSCKGPKKKHQIIEVRDGGFLLGYAVFYPLASAELFPIVDSLELWLLKGTFNKGINMEKSQTNSFPNLAMQLENDFRNVLKSTDFVDTNI